MWGAFAKFVKNFWNMYKHRNCYFLQNKKDFNNLTSISFCLLKYACNALAEAYDDLHSSSLWFSPISICSGG